MIRFLAWLFFIVIVVNVLRLFRLGKQIRRSSGDEPPDVQMPPYKNISDAEFEDITTKPPPSDDPRSTT